LPLRTVSILICAGALCLGQSGAGPASAPQASSPATEEPASLQRNGQTAPDSSGAVAAAPVSPKATAPAPRPAAVSDLPKATAPAKSSGAVVTPGVNQSAKPGAKPYVIGPLDVLDVNVWNDAHLSHIYDVSPDGTISMPLIGLVKADGLTQSELAAAIGEKLLAVLNTPEVNVQGLTVNSTKYSIFGAVNRPSEYPLSGETTVLDAFANCGGFHEFANQKKIRIIRKGVAKPFLFNYKDVSKGKNMEQNIVLQNGDMIFVDE
jgi:polysaccharide export outer membrane protein